MATTGIYLVLTVAGIAILFSFLATLRGPRTAFLAMCWVPLAGLVAAIVMQDKLSYAILAVLAAVIVASLGLVGLGACLCAKAWREKTGIGSVVLGILIAAAPLLVLLAIWWTHH